eukprot:3046000-Amphidinium_carterae.1
MQVNLLGVALRVAQHLGLALAEDDVRALLPLLTFGAMQSSTQFQPTSVEWKAGFKFVRKGIVGDFKEQFKGDMEEEFLAHVRETGVFTTFDPWCHAADNAVRSCGARYLASDRRND